MTRTRILIVCFLVFLGASVRPAAAQQLTGLEPGILIIQKLTQVATSGGTQAAAAQTALVKILSGPVVAQITAAGALPSVQSAIISAALAVVQKAEDDNNQGDNEQGDNEQK